MVNYLDYISKINDFRYISHTNKSKSIFSNIFYINQNKKYEELETNFFSNSFKKGSTFLDVGAQTGYYTLLAHSLGAKKVISIEPDLNSLKILKANIALNNLNNNTYILSIALYDISTSANIKSKRMKLIPNDDRFSLKNSDKQEIESNSTNFVKTQTIRYDDLKDNYLNTKIDFIKMDIEGAEFNALKGMKKMLAKDKPSILLSIHPQKMAPFNHKPDEIFSFLNDLNYKCIKISKIKKIKKIIKKIDKNENYTVCFIQE